MSRSPARWACLLILEPKCCLDYVLFRCTSALSSLLTRYLGDRWSTFFSLDLFQLFTASIFLLWEGQPCSELEMQKKVGVARHPQ